MTRDTTTGSDFESLIEIAIKRSCEKNKMTALSQVNVGEKPGGGRHRVDWEVFYTDNPNIRGLISCKIQNTSGTAEEKIVYEVIKLLHTMQEDSRYVHSWIVMGGTGWSSSMKNFIDTKLNQWVPAMQDKVTIFLSTDELVTKGISLD